MRELALLLATILPWGFALHPGSLFLFVIIVTILPWSFALLPCSLLSQFSFLPLLCILPSLLLCFNLVRLHFPRKLLPLLLIPVFLFKRLDSCRLSSPRLPIHVKCTRTSTCIGATNIKHLIFSRRCAPAAGAP